MISTQPREDLRPADAAEEARLTEAGFRWGPRGTHTSRTIMVRELRVLLAVCPPEATAEAYAVAIQHHNCLGKRTAATRKLTHQRLTELYTLDPAVTLFRVLRTCWYADRDGQPLLALLFALARDPLLRVTVAPILGMRPGEELARQQLTDALARALGDRLNDATRDKVVRNAASSWTQSGHLSGRGRKVRQKVTATPTATAYALLLGHLAGSRGGALFTTIWAEALDASGGEVMQLAQSARRLSLLDLNQSGGLIDVSFRHLLGKGGRR